MAVATKTMSMRVGGPWCWWYISTVIGLLSIAEIWIWIVHFYYRLTQVKLDLRVIKWVYFWWSCLSIGLAVLCSKTDFWPSYCQILTYLDKIFHTPIAVLNTLVGRLRPRSAPGWLQAKAKRQCFFVILVMHHKFYIEMTDRRDFGSKPSEWKWGRVLSWKLRNFVAWAEPLFRVPFDCPVHSLQETVLPQTNGTDGKPRLWSCAFC